MGIPERTLPAWMTRNCTITCTVWAKRAPELAARLRPVKPKRRKDHKQRITEHQRQQLVYELKSRGFDGSEKEVDLLLRGGSIPSGAGLRIFYRNQRLQEDDKWRDLY